MLKKICYCPSKYFQICHFNVCSEGWYRVLEGINDHLIMVENLSFVYSISKDL